MRRLVFGTLLPLLFHCAATTPDAPVPTQREIDLAAARAVFDQNLNAIRERDREAYLDCYRPAQDLIRAGPDGVELGYASFAEAAPASGSEAWPESLEASEQSVHWIRPGLVYGNYAYRVVFDGTETRGRSERLFMKIGPRWYIAMTSAFPLARPFSAEANGTDR